MGRNTNVLGDDFVLQELLRRECEVECIANETK